MQLTWMLGLLACEEAADSTTGADTGSTSSSDTDGEAADVLLSSPAWAPHDTVGSFFTVTWEQAGEGEVYVRYAFEEGGWLTTPTKTTAGGSNSQVVVGAPYGQGDIQWEIVVAATGQSIAGDPAHTEALDAGFPDVRLSAADEGLWLEEGRFLLSSLNEEPGGWQGGTFWAFIVDRQGRVVWARQTPDQHWTLFAQVSADGSHLLVDKASYWADWDFGAGSSVHRLYLDAEIDEIPTPGLHHAFVQLPDGSLAWGSQHKTSLVEELIERSPDGAQRVLWSCEEWGSSYCESNGLFYAPSTDSFLYSLHTHDTVIEIDRSSGAPLWWAGAREGGYAFSPADAQFSWQHGISWTDDGTLLVSTELEEGGELLTGVREYAVDHGAQTLTAVYSQASGHYAATNGDAWRLANGNTLHIVGSAGHILEYTPGGQVAWHLDLTDSGTDRLLGRGELIADLYALLSP